MDESVQIHSNDMTIKDFFSFRKNFFFWGNLLAMLIASVALVWGVFKWLESYTDHDVAVCVPDVREMPLSDAARTLKGVKLEVVVSDSIFNTSKPNGMVLDMTPACSSIVKEGRVVYLTVNTTRPPMRMLPDIIDNSSLRQAEAKLLAMGFKLEPNDSIDGEKDWVYGVKYRGASLSNGDEIPFGATLMLVVGSGDYSIDGESLSEEEKVRDTKRDEAIEIDDSWFD